MRVIIFSILAVALTLALHQEEETFRIL